MSYGSRETSIGLVYQGIQLIRKSTWTYKIHSLSFIVARLKPPAPPFFTLMISFPSTSWQSSLIQRTTSRRPRNDIDPSHGRAATAITARLYLTDFQTACTPGNLARLGITHVVSAIEFDTTGVFPPHIDVLHVPVRDSAEEQICEWFDPVVKFIKEALDNEDAKVLVRLALLSP
jgi:hypothetical protein